MISIIVRSKDFIVKQTAVRNPPCRAERADPGLKAGVSATVLERDATPSKTHQTDRHECLSLLSCWLAFLNFFRSFPRSNSLSHKCDPKKPAPPVTRMRFMAAPPLLALAPPAAPLPHAGCAPSPPIVGAQGQSLGSRPAPFGRHCGPVPIAAWRRKRCRG